MIYHVKYYVTLKTEVMAVENSAWIRDILKYIKIVIQQLF